MFNIFEKLSHDYQSWICSIIVIINYIFIHLPYILQFYQFISVRPFLLVLKQMFICTFSSAHPPFICAFFRSCSCIGLPNMVISFILTILLYFNKALKRCKSIKIIRDNQSFSDNFITTPLK